MKSFILVISLVCMLFSKESNIFKIIQPQTKTIYKESFASIVIKLNNNSKVKKIQISSKNDTYLVKVEKNKTILHKVVKLLPGENIYSIALYSDKKLLAKKQLNLFYVSEILEEGIVVPKGYKYNYFHTKKNEKLCSKCHDMNTDNKKLTKINGEKFKKNQKSYDSVFKDINQSNCYDCHKSVISRKNSHAPSVNLLCTKCHTGGSSEFNEKIKNRSKFSSPDPIDNICFSCHESKNKESWYKKESKHGPVMTGRCTKCHNPHSSDNLFFLKKPIWNLCTTCHSEKAKGKHVLSSFVYGRNKGAHPTKDRKDPARPGRDLVCSSCHNPHGSDSIYLLRMQGKSTYGVCKRCHDK